MIIATGFWNNPRYWAAPVVAGVAVLASLVTLVVTLTSNRRGEARNKLRDLIGAAMSDLGPPLVDVIATSKVFLSKKKEGKDGAAWLARAYEASAALKAARGTARLPLKGCDEAIRVLTRLPMWIAHKAANDTAAADDLIVRATTLRDRLDDVIYDCFWKGRRPSDAEVAELDRLANDLRDRWAGVTSATPEADEFAGSDGSAA